MSIKELSKFNGRVYVYLTDDEVGNTFMKQAESEGFTFGDGVKPTKRNYNRIMAVNDNQTINYVGAIGHMAYGNGAKTVGDKLLIRVNFKEYIEKGLLP